MEVEGTGARLLGLDGFVVLAAGEVDGELEVILELALPRAGRWASRPAQLRS